MFNDLFIGHDGDVFASWVGHEYDYKGWNKKSRTYFSFDIMSSHDIASMYKKPPSRAPLP
jgi:hypothetical protein